MKSRKLLLGALAAASVLLATAVAAEAEDGGTGASRQDTPSPEYYESLVASVSTSFGVDRDEAIARLDFDARARRVYDELSKALGDELYNAIFNPDEKSVVVSVVKSATIPDDLGLDGIPATFVTAERSRDEAEKLASRYQAAVLESVGIKDPAPPTQENIADGTAGVGAPLDENNKVAGAPRVGVSPNPLTGGVLIHISSDATADELELANEAERKAAADGVSVTRETKDDDARGAACSKTACDVIQAGIRVYHGAGAGGCTSNVLSHQSSSNNWFLHGAEHCGQGSVNLIHNSATLGTPIYGYRSGTTPYDFSAGLITSTMQKGLSVHLLNSTNEYQPLAALAAGQPGGTMVCSSGATYYLTYSTYPCGYVSTGLYTNWGGWSYYQHSTDTCAGDSGATIFLPTTIGGVYKPTPVGVVSVRIGGNPVCDPDGGTVWLADQFAAWNSWGWGLTYYAAP